MGANQIFDAKHRKWALHFNWNKVSAQTKLTLANQWSHDFKIFLILIRDQQNKRIVNQTPKSSNRSKTVSRISADFSSTKFYSQMRNHVVYLRMMSWTHQPFLTIRNKSILCSHMNWLVSSRMRNHVVYTAGRCAIMLFIFHSFLNSDLNLLPVFRPVSSAGLSHQCGHLVIDGLLKAERRIWLSLVNLEILENHHVELTEPLTSGDT
jgi:hypothetical protein